VPLLIAPSRLPHHDRSVRAYGSIRPLSPAVYRKGCGRRLAAKVLAVGWAWSTLSAAMVPVALVIPRQSFGLDVGTLLVKTARIGLGGAVMVGALLLIKAILPVDPWSVATEVVAGSLIYTAMLEGFCLPGHLARVVVLVRGAKPAVSS